MHHLGHFRVAAHAAIIDAYDRGASREFMNKLVSNAFNFVQHCRQWELMLAVIALAQEGKLTPEYMVELAQKLSASTVENKAELLAKAKLLAEMPHAEQTIN